VNVDVIHINRTISNPTLLFVPILLIPVTIAEQIENAKQKTGIEHQYYENIG
jgi:hypothetical protein